MEHIEDILVSDADGMRLCTDAPRIFVMNTEHHGNVWRHRHDFFEMVYVDQGFTLHSGYSRTQIKTAGDMFIVPSGTDHSYSRAYHAGIYNCLFYLTDVTDADWAARFAALPVVKMLTAGERGLIPAVRIPTSERQRVMLLLEQIRWERDSRSLLWQEKLTETLYQLLTIFSEQLTHADPSGADSGYTGYVFKALQYIEENYKRPVTQAEIAAAAGLSPDYMSRRFRMILGMTPTEYVRSLRIARSMDLLARSELPVAEIAASVGFGELSLFSRVFKQITGTSPTAFRKNSGGRG